MKNAMLALLMCLGVTACLDPQAPTDDSSETAAVDENTTGQSQAEQQITGHELDPKPTPKESCFEGAQGCIADVATCNFFCCDGSFGSVRSACGNCLGHANDFCVDVRHSGTQTAFWTP